MSNSCCLHWALAFSWIITRNTFTTYQGPIKLTLSALDKCFLLMTPTALHLFPLKIVLTASRSFFKPGELNKKALCQIKLPICLTTTLFPFLLLPKTRATLLSSSKCYFLFTQTFSPRFNPYWSLMTIPLTFISWSFYKQWTMAILATEILPSLFAKNEDNPAYPSSLSQYFHKFLYMFELCYGMFCWFKTRIFNLCLVHVLVSS